MDFDHLYHRSKNDSLKPPKQSGKGQRERYLNRVRLATAESTDTSNQIDYPKSRDLQSKRKLPGTEMSAHVGTYQNWEDGLSYKQTTSAASTPLERWLGESPRNESWNALNLLDSFSELTDETDITANRNIDPESNMDDIYSCDGTYGPTVQWELVEVPSEENGLALGRELDLNEDRAEGVVPRMSLR
jgi:hypothetical protein